MIIEKKIKIGLLILSVFIVGLLAGITFVGIKQTPLTEILHTLSITSEDDCDKLGKEYPYQECRNYYQEFVNYVNYHLNRKLKCNSDADCSFLSYADDENCKIIAYNTQANISLDEIYQYKGGHPKSCSVYSCGDPSVGMEAKCINRKCQIVESECGLSGSYCDENEYCNMRRQICSNRTNENINCSYVGDDKCYLKCETDADCGDKKCVPNIFCFSDICDVEDDFYAGITGENWEVKICQ